MSHHFARRGGSVCAILAVIGLLVTVSACGGSDEQSGDDGKEPVHIGVVLSLTGPYTAIGNAQRVGVDAAIKEVNEGGGVDGRPLDAEILDDGTDPSKAVVQTKSLIQDDQMLGIVGSSGSSQALAVQPTAVAAAMPYISLAAASPQVVPPKPHFFITPPTIGVAVERIGEYLAKKGLTKIALLHANDGVGKESTVSIKEQAEKLGLEIVSDHEFSVDSKNFTPELTRIKNSNAQAVWLWNLTPQAVAITKQFNQLKLPQQLVLNHGLPNSPYLEPVCPDADGAIAAVTYAQATEVLPEDNESREVAERVNKAIGGPSDQFQYDGYTGIMMLVEAMKATDGDLTRDAIGGALENLTYVGPLGTYRFKPDDHLGLRAESLVPGVIENCKFKPDPAEVTP